MTMELTEVTRGMPGEVVEHLQRHHVITLSTSSFTGMPHADTAVYMGDSHSIFFFAGEGTQMLRNLKDNRNVSFTVDDYTVDLMLDEDLVGEAMQYTDDLSAFVNEALAAHLRRGDLATQLWDEGSSVVPHSQD